MKAVLQFKDYHVLEAVYKSNPFLAKRTKILHPGSFSILTLKKIHSIELSLL
jgi:hypothetical protein